MTMGISDTGPGRAAGSRTSTGCRGDLQEEIRCEKVSK